MGDAAGLDDGVARARLGHVVADLDAQAAGEDVADPPDPTTWQDVTDPPARLRAALGELYAYFRDNEAMIANVTRDAALLPALAEVLGAPEATAHEQAMRATLLAGRDLHGARHAQLQAALGLALAFPTWQRLTRHEELSDQAAVEVMAGAVEAV